MTDLSLSAFSNLHGWRAELLWFPDPQKPKARHETDGLLVTGQSADGVVRVVAMGPYREVHSQVHSQLALHHSDLPVTHWPGLCIAPGFIDLHTHYPQTDVIGSPAEGLLPWLEQYTFPHEKQFSDPAYALEVTRFFLDELMRHGVTTALCFATAHPESVDVFMAEAQKRRLRMITGKVLQDRHSPDGLRDSSAQQSLLETESLINRWHGVDRLGYAITPRFAPTSSEAQLRGAGSKPARESRAVFIKRGGGYECAVSGIFRTAKRNRRPRPVNPPSLNRTADNEVVPAPAMVGSAAIVLQAAAKFRSGKARHAAGDAHLDRSRIERAHCSIELAQLPGVLIYNRAVVVPAAGGDQENLTPLAQLPSRADQPSDHFGLVCESRIREHGRQRRLGGQCIFDQAGIVQGPRTDVRQAVLEIARSLPRQQLAQRGATCCRAVKRTGILNALHAGCRDLVLNCLIAGEHQAGACNRHRQGNLTVRVECPGREVSQPAQPAALRSAVRQARFPDRILIGM